MFSYYENETDKTIDYSQLLNYSSKIFRSATFPIIWLDAQGDVHWNYAAQYETLNYLLDKQFPNENISTCLSRQLFILAQWGSGGFFSRHHAFIEHLGQTLYSPSMALPTLTRFAVSNAAREDFRSEGILRYYQSISLCSSHFYQPELKILRDRIHSIEQILSDTVSIKNISQLLERDEKTVRFKYSPSPWKFGYDHVPHRRWLFDRNRKNIKNILTYYSPIPLLIDHSNEHIYYDQNTSLDLRHWRARNYPQVYPSDVLNGYTIKDKIYNLKLLFFVFLL
jgi:hypothetical protein